MKSMIDIKADMSELYEQIKSQQIGPRRAKILNDIAGKMLKAEQMIIAREALDFNKAMYGAGTPPTLPGASIQ